MDFFANFFGTMYCWFENFFGLELANFMWGDQPPYQSDSNMFLSVGWVMVAISLLFFFLFYYIINNPRLNHWWGWMLFWITNGLVNLIVGWSWTLSCLYAGDMDIIDPSSGEQLPPDISALDCFCFGVTNMLLALFVMFLFSIAFKWWSRNCSKAPFVL